MFYGFHVGLKYDGGSNGVNQFLVLAARFAETSIYHGLVRHHRGEALIITDDVHVGQQFLQAVDDGLDVLGAVGRVVLHVFWFTDDNALHLLRLEVIQDEVDELMRLHRRQSIRDDLQRVSDGDAAALSTSIYCHYPCHVVQMRCKGTHFY